jgi:hypothetical protein
VPLQEHESSGSQYDDQEQVERKRRTTYQQTSSHKHTSRPLLPHSLSKHASTCNRLLRVDLSHTSSATALSSQLKVQVARLTARTSSPIGHILGGSFLAVAVQSCLFATRAGGFSSAGAAGPVGAATAGCWGEGGGWCGHFWFGRRVDGLMGGDA